MSLYAIIILTNLKVRSFGDRESVKNAVADYNRSGIPILVFKWSDNAKVYAPMEVREI